MKALLEVRTQKQRGGKGPGLYVAVQKVPDGVEPLKCLNHAAAKRRGIEIIWCGEGYWNRKGPKSMYGQALAKANAICEKVNG
jgi:hypothetical protein